MKIHPHLKKILRSCTQVLALTLMAGVLLQGSMAAEFTVNGTSQSWAPTSNLVIVPGTATGSTVVVTGVDDTDTRLGVGWVDGDGSSAGNITTITDSVLFDIAGGTVDGNGTAVSNALHIKNSQSSGFIYGGTVTGDGASNGNSVDIQGITSHINGDTYGGFVLCSGASGQGEAQNNTVRITGSTMNGDVTAAHVAGDGTANNNSLTLDGATLYNDATGGMVEGDGEASSNSVIIRNLSDVQDYVAGGWVDCDGAENEGKALNNTVSIQNSTVGAWVMGGFVAKYGSASDNSVTLADGSKVKDVAYGGYVSGDGNASNNRVTLTGASSTMYEVVGGYVYGDGNASNNSVTLMGGSSVGDVVCGGYVYCTGSANGNKVSLSESAYVEYDVMGGCVRLDGNADGNTVTIANSTIDQDVIGGYVYRNGSASANMVTISLSEVADDVYGGNVEGSGLACSNKVSVTDSDVYDTIAAGYVYVGSIDADAVGEASGNTLTLVRTIAHWDDVHGGYVDGDGKANGNTVDITGGVLGNGVYGGYVSEAGDAQGNVVNIRELNLQTVSGLVPDTSVYGGCVKDGNALGNRVTISDSLSLSYVCGGEAYTSGNASDNTVTITDSVMNWGVNGGYAKNGSSHQNTVNISGSSVERSIWGGESEAGSANGNTVTVTETVVGSEIIGGFATTGASDNVVSVSQLNKTVPAESVVTEIIGAYTSEGDATGNSVSVADAVASQIYGGISGNGNASGNSVSVSGSMAVERIFGGMTTGSNTNATNNHVTLAAGTTGLDNTLIYGGYSQNPVNPGDVVSGNLLTLDGFQGAVGGIYNFEAINISLSNWNPSEYVVSITGDNTDLTGVRVTVNMVSISGDAELPKVGETLRLFENAAGTEAMTLTMGNVTNVRYGTTQVVDFIVSTEGGTATIDGVDTGESPDTPVDPDAPESPDISVGDIRLNPQLKALAEGRIATLTLNRRAGDLVAEKGIVQAARAAAAPQGGAGVAAFFSMSSGHDKVDSGSHVDVDGLSAMLGASVGLLGDKALTLGGFVETGWGQYTTHNSFADMPDVRGSGESSYCGAGVLLRYDLAAVGARGLSVDASLRAGQQATDFCSYDVYGKYASYDLNGGYISGHVGVSYTFAPTDKVDATVYARYLWSHLCSDSTPLDGGTMDFDSMHSSRLRLGARAAWKLCPHWTPYAGLAYEWEGSCSARATVGGERVDAPSMRGGSVIAEVGAVWQPCENKPLWVEGGIQASAGKTQGYGTNVGCTIAF